MSPDRIATEADDPPLYRFVHREIVILAVLVAVTVVAFFLTRRFAASNAALRLQDGRQWYAQGETAVREGQLVAAVSLFQRAVAEDPTDLTYQKALARALIAAHQDDGARQLLLELRDRQPEDSETNLQLARLEVRRGDRAAAGRYYQTVLIGFSRPDERQAQREVRTEFIEFLLSQGERDRALSELLVLETRLPDDVSSQLAAGRMLLAAGDARRAADHFERALRNDPNNQAALSGAGEASFELGDFARARRYFNALKDEDNRTKELHTLTDLVLGNDPLAPRLSGSERTRRLAVGVEQARRRLEACQARAPAERQNATVELESGLGELRGLDVTMHGRNKPGTFDEVEAGLDLVVRAERLADRACGLARSARPGNHAHRTASRSRRSMTRFFASGYQQLRLREHQLFLALSIVIGILAGLSAVLFTLAIERTSHLFFGLAPSSLRLFALPALVSVVTGVVLAGVFPDVRGSGVPQTEAAYRLHGGFIPGRVPIGKFLTGVLCIGSGHSMGREGPSVQIGAGIASVVGRWLKLSPDRAKALVPVGAAGALSAAFNTPVAAVIFALEEIIGDMNAGLLGSTVVASVASVIVERSILGNTPLFRVPAYHLVHPAELIGYALLGVVGGLVSLLFCKSLLGLRALFRRMPAWTQWVQPAMGGLAIGLLLIVSPAIMGVGYEYVDQALNGGLVFRTLLALCLLKLAATVISYSSGNAGGIFGPSLYIGAMAGGAVGAIVQRVAPFPTGEPGAYALVGMGTLFAGIIRAPMTSVFMIFEITQDYQIFVPLMVANLLSFVISRRYQPTPLYHALLEQDHVHIPSIAVKTATRGLTAQSVMSTDLRFIDPDRSAESIWSEVSADGGRPLLVGTSEELLGILRPERLSEAVEAGNGSQEVRALIDESFNHAHPDHPIEVVLERLADSDGLLPIISRSNTRRVEGVVTLDDITRALGRRRT